MEEHPDEFKMEEDTPVDADERDEPEPFDIPVEEETSNLQERLVRLQAEFDNFRKRMDARFAEAARFASEGIILKVLEVLDNLQRALAVDFDHDSEAAREGIVAIEQQIMKILSQEDVRPIESIGKQFDPYYQHAVDKESNPDKPDGLVMQEYQRGYMIKEKVLRPALVVVNRHETPSAIEVDVTEETDPKEKGE